MTLDVNSWSPGRKYSLSPENFSIRKNMADVDSVDFDKFDFNQAKKVFRNMNYKSNYDSIYGDKPK